MAKTETDVVYATAGGVDLKLDVYRPEGEPKRVAILYFHGGGWRGGSKDAMRPYAEAMAGRGFVGLPAQYRLLGEAPWPAQIHDVKAAIRWARAHAEELGVDQEHIVVWGHSAGAHLALLAGGTPDHPRFEGDGAGQSSSTTVAGVIAFFPPTGFFHGAPDEQHGSSGAALLGENYSAEAAHDASPITYVNSAFPPTFFLHGTQDRIVHHSASVAMHKALREARAPADIHLFHGHTHEFIAIPSVRELVMAEVAYFLDRSVINPARYQAEAEEFSMFARRAAQERRAGERATPA